MTFICIWLDESEGVSRLTALADMRISTTIASRPIKVSDLATKLFVIPYRCYPLEFDAGFPALRAPYALGLVGIGFSGDVQAGLFVVEQLRRLLGALIDEQGGQPRFEEASFHAFARAVLQAYCGDHSRANDKSFSVSLYGFGWEDGRPWISRNNFTGTQGVRGGLTFPDAQSLVTGGYAYAASEEAISIVRSTVRRRKRHLRVGSGVDPAFDLEVQKALQVSVERRATEEAILEMIGADEIPTVGGTLQKLELRADNSFAFTRDIGPYPLPTGESLSQAGLLRPLDLTERMGWRPKPEDGHG